jgi:hypothetical protein
MYIKGVQFLFISPLYLINYSYININKLKILILSQNISLIQQSNKYKMHIYIYIYIFIKLISMKCTSTYTCSNYVQIHKDMQQKKTYTYK